MTKSQTSESKSIHIRKYEGEGEKKGCAVLTAILCGDAASLVVFRFEPCTSLVRRKVEGGNHQVTRQRSTAGLSSGS